MPRGAKTHEQFVKEVLNKHGKDYTVMGKYVKSLIKVDVKHKCGHIYSVYPHNILAGYGCPECFGTKQKTAEEFLTEFRGIYGSEYELLEQYVKAHTKVVVKHLICGHEYRVFPIALSRGDKCPMCSPNRKKTTKEFKQIVAKRTGDEYKVLGEYIGALKPIKMRHKCGNEYEVTPSNFLSGCRCPICSMWERASKRAWTHEEFVNKVYELTNNDYEVLGQYKNKRTKIKIKHIECGSEFDMRPGDFVSGTRCPKCDLSKGEQAIKDFLVKHNIPFETQYMFDGCRHKQKLRFDFAILCDDDKVSKLIEFQGIQHYKPTNYFDGQAKLKRQQRNDAIKRDFCKKQNVPLLEIPYWELDNIKKILAKALCA